LLHCDCRSFSDIIVSQGSVATHMRSCGSGNLLQSPTVKNCENRLRINRAAIMSSVSRLEIRCRYMLAPTDGHTNTRTTILCTSPGQSIWPYSRYSKTVATPHRSYPLANKVKNMDRRQVLQCQSMTPKKCSFPRAIQAPTYDMVLWLHECTYQTASQSVEPF